MSNGELRMRFVSFSDGYTSYEELEPGVIDRKDGEIFFEAMSRPKDSLISENPSIVNMLEIRNPSAQPAFLSNTIQVPAENDGLDNDGVGGIDQPGETKTITLSNATIFGEEVFVPPSGFVTQSISTAGIDRAEINFDITKSFYISGSDSQDLFYDSVNNGMKGSWVFDRSVGQPVTGISGEPASFLTVLDKVSQNLSSSSYFGTNASYMEYSSGQHQNTASPNFSESTFLKHIAYDKGNQKSFSVQNKSYIRISLDEYMYGRIPDPEGSLRNIVVRPTGEPIDNPNSNFGHLVNRDWDGSESAHETDIKYSDFQSDTLYHGNYRWINQFSIWFYIKESAFDSGNTQTIATFYATSYNNVESESMPRAKIYTIRNQLFLNLYDENANIHNPSLDIPQPEFTMQYGLPNTPGPIEPEKWHRVSFVYGTPYEPGGLLDGQMSHDSFAYLVLDGNLSNTNLVDNNKKTEVYSSNLLNISTVILGNFFTKLDGTPGSLADSPDPTNSNPKFLDGYIQSCEYYITPARREFDHDKDEYKYPGDEFGISVPAFGKNSVFSEYSTYQENKESYNFSGESLDLDEDGEHIVDFFVRSADQNDLILIDNKEVSVLEILRRWIDYAPIPSEGALYWAGFNGGIYVKETQLDRGVKKAELDEIVELAESAMSGTLQAYSELKLLSHKDISGRENRELGISRHRTTLDGSILQKATDPEGFTPGETRFFKTRKPEIPDRELLYGQLPDDYFSGNSHERFVTLGPGLESKISGKVFKKEATVYHIEEIMDSDLDNDDTTFSSSRVPNFFFLPPIGASDYFQFQGLDLEEGKETISNAMSFRNFLNRRATSTSAVLDDIATRGVLNLTKDDSLTSTFATYKNLMKSYYQSLMPEEFTDRVLKTLYMDVQAKFSDSNAEMIRYVIRNLNNKSLYGNENSISLEDYSEIIEFTDTSEFNNSFIQMFEVSADDGKSKFSKLAIRYLGVVKKSAITRNERADELEEEAAIDRYKNDLIQKPKFSEGNRSEQLQEIYCHVFVFGKILNKREETPGTSIYFTPIFSLELEIGGE